MGTNECSQPAPKSSWDRQDFGDISMVLRMAHFRKSTGPRWVKLSVIGRFDSTRVPLISSQLDSHSPRLKYERFIQNVAYVLTNGISQISDISQKPRSSISQRDIITWWRHQLETFSALRVTGHLCGEFTATKASDAELWCFLWSASE